MNQNLAPDMISKLKYCALLITGVLGLIACENQKEEEINAHIQEVKAKYAPDGRVALFDVYWEDNMLKGETNLPEAKEHLLTLLKAQNSLPNDSIEVLPSQELGEHTQALVTLSVANIRSEPKHAAELATQATMGTPLKVLKRQGSWYLIQTPDKYISWVDAGGITLVDEKEMTDWVQSDKVIFTDLMGYVHEDGQEKNTVSDLTAGNVLQLTGEENSHYTVSLPDGRSGVIAKSAASPVGDWMGSLQVTDESLISTAKSMMGVPYLWGGTSSKGVDCSGFTKTVYFLHGLVIPRDASQQVLEGALVDTDKDWDKLEVGDLLFFGTPATENAKERVVHVGMWIGHHRFIHASGRVRVSSFDPKSPDFDEYELNRYLKTKRIRQTKSEHILTVGQIIN